MKKLPLLVILFYFLNLSIAISQTDQGKTILGVSTTLSLAGTGQDLMSIGFSSMKYKSDADGYSEPDPDKMTSINFLPKVGFFVVNNLAIGLDLNVAYAKETDGEDSDKYSRTLFSVGPFIRYYIPTNSVKPFIEASGAFGELKNKFESDNFGDDEYKSSVTSFGAGIGMAIPIGQKASFDLIAGYNSLTIKDKEDNDDNNRTVIGTFGIKLGFVLFLGN